MTVAEDRLARRQNLDVVMRTRNEEIGCTEAWIADTVAELEEADEARDRLAELECRVQELTADLDEMRDRAERAEARNRSDMAVIATLRAERSRANAAPRVGW